MLLRFFAKNYQKFIRGKKGLGVSPLQQRASDYITYSSTRNAGKKRGFVRFDGQSFQTGIKDYKPGCNIIGSALRVSGISKGLREMAVAMDKTQIPFSTYNYRPKKNDLPASELIGPMQKTLPYKANILVLNDNILVREALEPKDKFKKHYNIVYPAWEYTKLAFDRMYSTNIAHEFWTISRFNQEVYAQQSVQPVIHMPEVIEPRLTRSYSRREFGLPDSAFIFCFMFDHEAHDRKNPMGLIRAFQKAFTPTDNAYLVLKTHKGSKDDPILKQLHEAIKPNQNIQIISCMLPDEGVYGLLSVIDCYVSLHRSEGFGRTLVEAMKFGKPLIATNFSGSTDYVNSKIACPVDYKLIDCDDPVTNAMHAVGMQYADPDIDHAIHCMKKVAADSHYAKTIAAAGQAFVDKQYSYENVGRIIRERLELLGLIPEL